MEIKTKICRGQFHPPGGEEVPLSEFTTNKSGPRKGKPLSRCKKCRSRRNSKTVPAEFFLPILEKLAENEIFYPNLITRKRINKDTFLSLKRQEQKLNNISKINVYKPQKIELNKHKITKLSYEDRIGLKKLIAERKKNLYLKDRKLLGSIVK